MTPTSATVSTSTLPPTGILSAPNLFSSSRILQLSPASQSILHSHLSLIPNPLPPHFDLRSPTIATLFSPPSRVAALWTVSFPFMLIVGDAFVCPVLVPLDGLDPPHIPKNVHLSFLQGYLELVGL